MRTEEGGEKVTISLSFSSLFSHPVRLVLCEQSGTRSLERTQEKKLGGFIEALLCYAPRSSAPGSEGGTCALVRERERGRGREERDIEEEKRQPWPGREASGEDVFVRLVLQRACHPRVMAEGGQNFVPRFGQRGQDHFAAYAQG